MNGDEHRGVMESESLRGGRLRQGAMGDLPLREQSLLRASWLAVLPRARVYGWGKRLVLLGCLLGYGLLGPGLARAYDGTNTGSPLNLSLPTEDTEDWADQVNANFNVINSSFSDLGAVDLAAFSASTVALADRATSLESSTQALDTAKLSLSGGYLTGYVQNSSSHTAESFTTTSFSSSPVHYAPAGASNSPSIAYSGDTDTGIYFSGTDVRFTANGTTRGSIVTGIGVCGGSGSTGTPCLRSNSGSDSDPAFQWGNDSNTGMWRVSNNRQAVVNGGVRAIDTSETETYIYPGTVQTSTFSTTGYSLSLSSGLAVSGPFAPQILAKADFDARIGVVGQVFLCSDCVIPYSICVGTGTALSGFKVSHSATVGCGTDN